MSIEDQVRDTLLARARQVTPYREAWSEIEQRLDAPARPSHRETRRRVVAAIVAFAVFGGAALFAWKAFAPGGNPATRGSAGCRSADEPDLITCTRALQLAHREFTGADIASASATLVSYQAPPEDQVVRAWKVVFPNVEVHTHHPPGSPGCVLGDFAVTLDAHTGAFLVEGSSGNQGTVPCPSPSPTVPTVQGVRVTVFPLGTRSAMPNGVMAVGNQKARVCTQDFEWTLPDGTRVHRMSGTGRKDAIPTCDVQAKALRVVAGTPISVVSGGSTTYLRATRTEAPLYPGVESVVVEAHWPEGMATFIVPLRVVVTHSSPTKVALTCGAGDQVKFKGPTGVRILPGGSGYIVGNLGIPLSDVVEQMTKAQGGAQWYGTWQVVREGAIIAAVNFPTLDGVACRGWGVGGA